MVVCTIGTFTVPRRAKDTAYAKAVMDAWANERYSESLEVEYCFQIYQADDTQLYGTCLRRSGDTDPKLHIILFHTGAGPHDVSLLWKAWSILQTFSAG